MTWSHLECNMTFIRVQEVIVFLERFVQVLNSLYRDGLFDSSCLIVVNNLFDFSVVIKTTKIIRYLFDLNHFFFYLRHHYLMERHQTQNALFYQQLPESFMSTHFVKSIVIDTNVTVIYGYGAQSFKIFWILFLHFLGDIEGISQLVFSALCLNLCNTVQHLHLQ